jgi:hypothetical protein
LSFVKEVKKMVSVERMVAAMEQLRLQGKWDEASAYRNEVRMRLRTEGMSRAEAKEAAWVAMVDRYPPRSTGEPAVGMTDEREQILDVVTEPLPAIDDEVLDKLARSTPNLVEDILWVYYHLEDKGVQPKDAPGLGAWSLLLWARDYPNRFFEQLLPKAIEARNAETGASEDIHDFDPGIAEIKRMLAQIRSDAAR